MRACDGTGINAANPLCKHSGVTRLNFAKRAHVFPVALPAVRRYFLLYCDVIMRLACSMLCLYHRLCVNVCQEIVAQTVSSPGHGVKTPKPEDRSPCRCALSCFTPSPSFILSPPALRRDVSTETCVSPHNTSATVFLARPLPLPASPVVRHHTASRIHLLFPLSCV